jgi:cysteine-rich repeat protein
MRGRHLRTRVLCGAALSVVFAGAFPGLACSSSDASSGATITGGQDAGTDQASGGSGGQGGHGGQGGQTAQGGSAGHSGGATGGSGGATGGSGGATGGSGGATGGSGGTAGLGGEGGSAGAAGGSGGAGGSSGSSGSAGFAGVAGAGGVIQPFCGDGHIDANESCDDGNTATNDGCSPTCTIELGFQCTGTTLSVCAGICGDGVAVKGEPCDDGNTTAGDGCSPTCTFEATCGNGIVEPGETCDSTSGCSSCKFVTGTVCGDAIDLNNAANVTVQAGVTTYAGTTSGSTLTAFGTPSCSGGTTGVPRRIHQYRVGPHPAVLTVETPAVGAGITDTSIWAYRDCLDTSVELACNEDMRGALSSWMSAGYLPAGTAVFIVVAGYDDTQVGAYSLRVTETPASMQPASGTCPSPVATLAGAGTYAGVTLASDIHNGSNLCPTDGPDAVYEIPISATSDLIVTAATTASSYDLNLQLESNCTTGTILSCDGDHSGPGEREFLTARSLTPGSYYLFVGGVGAADFGPYSLSIGLVGVLAENAPCTPGAVDARCTDGTVCRGATCQKPIDLLFADFSVDLSPFVATDYTADGVTWAYCDPMSGCASDNHTGIHLSDPYALVRDAPGASLHGEILTCPVLNASGLTSVVLELDQAFDHVSGASDLGAIEVTTDGTTWAPVAAYTADVSGHVSIDLSAQAAGHATVQVRFRFDDQTNVSDDPFAGSWALDNVHVYGF